LHYGHIKHLEEAKKRGDRLIVSVTSDRFVNKGPGRPYFTQDRRSEMLRALTIVDEVFISDERTALGAIRRFRPDFFVKGPDYKDFTKDLTGEIVNEKREVEKYGGKLVFTDDETHSSSSIINRFFSSFSEDQKTQIEKIKSIGGMASIESALNEVAKLKVLVVGEPILDIYRFVHPEGISSKSPTVSCRFEYEEVYQGGSWAIQSHLRDFCGTVGLTHNGKIAKKIRYIAGTQRVFEVTEIDDSYKEWQPYRGDHDVIVAADFGHGMFNGDELEKSNSFVGLNVQTNSSNFGFNVFHKHKRFDYLCLDTREARLATHDRYSDPITIAKKIKEEINKPFGFTVGANGAYLMDKDTHYSPAFSDVIIDATGAGDAYFAITTVLLASNCHRDIIPFLGNVFAGLKTKIIGNKASVSKSSLLKACKGILS
jgi:cytidyltransferase-like protein